MNIDFRDLSDRQVAGAYRQVLQMYNTYKAELKKREYVVTNMRDTTDFFLVDRIQIVKKVTTTTSI